MATKKKDQPWSLSEEQISLLSHAKMHMLRLLPYWGTFLIGTHLEPDWSIETACTDMVGIKYNPSWLLGDDADVPVAEVVRVLAHEVGHITFKHGLRVRYRHPGLWNIACDHAINLILEEGEVGVYPSKVQHKLCDPRFKGMSAEDIYDELLKDFKKKSGGGKGPDKQRIGGVILDLNSPDPGGMGGFSQPSNEDGSKMTEAQVYEVERSVDARISTAAAVAKSQGKLPAGLERYLQIAMTPEIDWRQKLWQFVSKIVPSDMTWTRPARRHIWNDLYLPSVLKQGAGQILVVMDTSGSVSFDGPDSEGGQFAAEIKAIHEDVRPEQLHVMYCDAEVAKHPRTKEKIDTFEPHDEFECVPRGGGGTDFRPPFILANEQLNNIQCAIYLTDMMGSFPSEPPPYPVMWVATTDIVAPFGETIRIRKGK